MNSSYDACGLLGLQTCISCLACNSIMGIVCGDLGHSIIA